MAPSSFDRLISPFAGLVDRLCDPKQRRRVAVALVSAYGAVWFLYGVIAKSSQDINADMAEMVIWAREPALGYPKHPPLLAFVVKLWFAIFPLTDWAYLLLAMITVSVGIYLAFELSGSWLDGEKRAAVPFLLGVIPFYNVFALKFDQNSALIPLWGLAMLASLRSLETRHAGWAAITGLAAAAAMLTKYWSAFLLVAMTLMVLLDRRRGIYFRSTAPWITGVIFLLAILPHAIWLVHENFVSLGWIAKRRITLSAADFLRSLTEYLGGTIGYVSVALALVAILVHPSGAAVRDSWFARDPPQRSATVLFWTPLLLPIPAALAARTDLLSLWNGPALGLLPVMMLASPRVVLPRVALVRLAAIVTAITLLALVASPIAALTILMRGVENDAAYTKLAAEAIEKEWHQTTNSPLRLVAGPFALVDSAAFYMIDKPSTYADFGSDTYTSFSPYLSPWVSEARIAREGIAIVCEAEDHHCLSDMSKFVAGGPPGRRSEVTLTRHWLGLAGSAKRFVIATVPPHP
jgi:4-amino-4-deoxy-L-arabinose transferase-like glycosyltransferase